MSTDRIPTGLAHDVIDPFRLLVESVKDYAIFMLDPGGIIVSWNPGAQRLFGYTGDEAIGRNYERIFTAEDTAGGAPHDELVVAAAQGRVDREGWRVRKDGSRFWVNAVLTALRNKDGRLQGYAKISRDLTERRQAEERLRDQEAFLRTVVDAALDAIITIDAQGRVVEFNPAAAATFGYPRAEALGRDIAELIIPPAYRAAHRRGLAHFLATGDGPALQRRLELPALGKDGREFPIELTIACILRDGPPLFTAYVRDIRQRKHAEQQLRDSEERFRHLANNVPVVIWVTDAAGETTFVNDQWYRLTDQAPGQALGRGWLDCIHPEDRGNAGTVFQAANAQQTDFRIEYRLRCRDSAYRWVLDFARPLWDGAHAFQGFIGCVLDITEQRSVEEQLRQAQKMEAFGQLAGGVAHDFNNLLTVINGYGDMLHARLAEDSVLRPFTQAIREAGARAADLTRQMLAFSRQTMLAPRVLDLNAIVRDVEKMLRRLIGEDVFLTTALAAAVCPVKVDPTHIGQVLMNLAVNARDAMPRGGRLTIETGRVDLDHDAGGAGPELPPGPYVRLAVRDTGQGMTPAVQARVFEPFFTTKGDARGTGLGLAVVHGIVKQSGGHIAVASAPGAGATFTLYFPAASEALTAAPADAAEAPRGSETILLVEDEDGVRELAELALSSHGYNVLAAAGAAEAFRLAEKQPPDLLVTDVVMPGTGGGQLAELLRSRHPALKVLFLSGYTDDAVLRHGILQDQVPFLQKPFTPLSLARCVRQVLDG